MNKRIRELAKHAGGHFSTHTLASNPVQYRESVELWDDKIEKFAELIVSECAEHALTFNNNIQSNTDKVMRSNLNRVSDYIKDRMGVEL